MQQLQPLARHKLLVCAAIAVILGGVLLGWHWFGGRAEQPTPALVAADTSELDGGEVDTGAPAAPTPEQIPDEQVVVYISGAVQAPDVYQLPKAARIKDLIVAAGGFTGDAAPERINLAERIADGQHIHVPRQDEAAPDATSQNASSAGGARLIDINAANAAELDGLPGIGQALAQRIIDYRTSNGAFNAIDDLRNVKGIGPALFEKIAPLITVGT